MDFKSEEVNSPVFVFGASIGWMSPMTLLLQSKDSPKGVPLTDTEASWILLLLSLETWALVLARALIGVTMAGCYVTCPTYTKEISEDNMRGALGCLIILFHTSGNLFLYIIGDILSYRTILWICLALPAFHVVIFMAMPESPSYLVKKGNEESDEAFKVLAWLRCRRMNELKIQQELDNIKKEQKNDEGSNKFLFLLATTALISGLGMCSLASWFLARSYEAYTPNWLPIVTLCMCIFCDSAGLQPVSVVLTGEIFSFKIT
ncbi:unnamed protein product [Parnassius apollo]|uniref:(apollo) hypothetical protein n=1 Tax=Parnassius apollo TaxID=110799 RepID=A0A8S3WD67_PARAO|nr:unnamed protein product [Parnassius apollo]